MNKISNKVWVKNDMLRRMLILIVIVLVLAAAFYIGNIISRGSSKGEERIINALFTALNKSDISAKITTSKSGSESPFNINGNIAVADGNKINADLAFSLQQGDTKVSSSFDVRGIFGDKSSLFIKTSGLGSLVNALLSGAPEAKLFADQAVAKINGKWMVVSNNGQSTVGGQGMNCGVELFNKIRNDEGLQNQLIKIYKKNRFIFVKNTSHDGDDTLYSVKINPKILSKFMNSLQGLDSVKNIKSCESVDLAATFADEPSDNQSSQSKNKKASQESYKNITLDFKLSSQNQLKAVALASNSSDNTAMRITANISYDKPKMKNQPTENIVPATTILPEISQMVGVFQQAAQQQRQQQQQVLQQMMQ